MPLIHSAAPRLRNLIPWPAGMQSQSHVAAAVQLPGVSDVKFGASLAELRFLARTPGYEITATFTQKRASFDATA